MTTSQIQNFIDACKAEEKDFMFEDDMGTNYYNNDRAVIVLQGDMLYNLRATNKGHDLRGTANVTLMGNNVDDIRAATVMGTFEEIRKVLEHLGISLTDEQQATIVKIDRANLQIIPRTGDYHNIFHKISKEAYDALTPEEQAEYDAHVEEEKKRLNPQAGVAARITIG